MEMGPMMGCAAGRTPVEWRMDRSVERGHLGDRIERMPVHPGFHTYSKSFVNTGPAMAAQTTDQTKPAAENAEKKAE